MAKKFDTPGPPVDTFSISFEYSYYEKWPLSGGVIFVIVFFVLLFVTALAIFIVLLLNKRGIITIYIPSYLRKWCLKDFMSPEQIDAIEAKKDLEKAVERSKSLEHRKAIKPGINGYKIDDDYFSPEGDPPPNNPNDGFDHDRNDVVVAVVLKRNKSIDHSPVTISPDDPDSSVSDSNSGGSKGAKKRNLRMDPVIIE